MKKLLWLFAAVATVAMTSCKTEPCEGPDCDDSVIPTEQGFNIELGTGTAFEQSFTVSAANNIGAQSLFVWGTVTAEELLTYKDENQFIEQVIDEMAADPANANKTMAELITQMTTTNGVPNNGAEPRTITTSFLDPGTEYYIVVCGVNLNGVRTCAATKQYFVTQAPPPVQNASLNFEWTAKAVNSARIEFTVTPSNDTDKYYMYTLQLADYTDRLGGNPAGVKAGMPQIVKSFARQTPGINSIPDYIKAMSHVGPVGPGLENEFYIGGMAPLTEYVAFVCGIDDYGRATTDVQVLRIKTPDYTPSDAVVTMSARLFDGDEAVKADPVRYPEAAYGGSFFMRVKPQFSVRNDNQEDTPAQWSLMWKETDQSSKADGELFMMIEADGMVDEATGSVRWPATGDDDNYTDLWGIPKTINITFYFYSVAYDAEGDPGPIGKMSIRVNKDSVKPISTIDESPYTRAAHYSAAHRMAVEQKEAEHKVMSL